MAQAIGKKIAVATLQKLADAAGDKIMNAIHRAHPEAHFQDVSPMDIDDNPGGTVNGENTANWKEDWQKEFHTYAKHGRSNDIGEQNGFVDPHGPHQEEHKKIIELIGGHRSVTGFSQFASTARTEREGSYKFKPIMPRRRYKGYRRTRYRPRRRYRHGSSSNKIAKIARNQHELKYVDNDADLTEANLSYDNNIGYLAAGLIAQGVGNTQRIARKIFIENLYVNGIFRAAAADVVVRLVVVRYRFSNGATPAIADLFEGGIAAAGQVLAFKDLIDGKNARFLWDHTWNFSNATSNNGAHFRKRIKIKKRMLYDGATATIGDVMDGALGIFCFTDSTDAAGASPTLELKTRVRYRDA